jgi:hypothetical protein
MTHREAIPHNEIPREEIHSGKTHSGAKAKHR